MNNTTSKLEVANRNFEKAAMRYAAKLEKEIVNSKERKEFIMALRTVRTEILNDL